MLTGTVLLAMLLAPGLFPFDGYMTMFLPIIYASTNVTIEFGPYMLTMIPYILVSVLLLMPMMKLLGYDPSCIAKADFSEIEAKYAGGLSKAQKSLLACVCIFILGAILVSFVPSANAFLSKVKEFGVYGWAMLFCVVMMVIKVDGKPICDPIEAGKSVSWDAIFIIASATVVSGALTSTETGVSEAISALCAPLLAKAGPLSCILLVAFIVLLLTNFLNNIATMFIFIAVICAIYANGVDIPFVAVIQLIPTLGMVGIAIPASSLFGALYYAQDYTTPASIAKCSFILILYVVIMTAVVYVPLTMLFL